MSVPCSPLPASQTQLILEKLAGGFDPYDILTTLNLGDPELLDTVVDFARTLPPDHLFAKLVDTYQKQHQQTLGNILQKFKQHCQEKYGTRLEGLILFGSQARGEATPWSDIDILIILKSPLHPAQDRKATTDFIADTSLETGKLISRIFISAEEYQTSNTLLLRKIRQEGKRL